MERPDGLFYEFKLEKDESVIEIMVDKEGKAVNKNTTEQKEDQE